VRTLLAIGLSGVLLASIGCAKFGYTDRVLHRVQSPDGRTLAVLTGHTATIRMADVDWALAHPEIHERHWVYRDFSFSTDKVNKRATDLRFVSAFELEFHLCEYSLRETQANNGQIRCSQQAQPQRLRIPLPLIAGRPA
jgi:hypothetical protein